MLHLQLQNAKLQNQLDGQVAPASEKAPSVAAPTKPAEMEEEAEPVADARPSMDAEPALVGKKRLLGRISQSSTVDPSQLDTQVIPPTQPSPEHCPSPSPSAVPEDDLDHDIAKLEEDMSDVPEDEKETRPAAVDDEPMEMDSDGERAAEADSLRQEELAALETIRQANKRLEVLRAQRHAVSSSKPGSGVIVETREGLLKKVEPAEQPSKNHMALSNAIRKLKETSELGACETSSTRPSENDPADDIINTSTHKTEWAKLDRLMKGSRGDEFPHMRALFHGKQSDNCL